MQWIQRNLFYVTWGGIAAALSVIAFFFWYSGYQRNSELDGQLDAERQQLETLLRADPRPTPENVQLVRDDAARVEKQVTEARRLFRPANTSRMDAGAFRKLLDDSIFDLTKRASSASVTLPQNFNFTFSAQRVAVNFSSGSINRLVARLDDVKALSQILFNARVYSIESIRRSPAAEDEPVSSPDLLITRPATNAVTGFVRYPYEVIFTGFTRELGKVLDSLNQSSDFFVVRNIGVVPAPPPPVAVLTPGQSPGAPGLTGGFQRRPPVRPPGGAPAAGGNPDDPDDPSEDPAMNEDDPAMTAAPAAPQARGPQFRAATTDTVLDEQLLQFTLTVDLIRAPAGAKAK